MSSQKLSLDDGHLVEEEHKKDFYHIIHSSTLLLFQQISYSYIMCCLEREDTSEFSILFLYLLSGLHLRQLLTLTNHSHHECYFSLLLDSDTSILSRLTFFILSKIFGKNHKRYNCESWWMQILSKHHRLHYY